MGNLKSFSLILVIICLGFACISSAYNNENKCIIIHSVPTDSIFTEINIVQSTTKQTISFKGGKTFRDEIATVETFYFYANSNGNYFDTEIFITPGDSVSFKTVFKNEGSYDVIFEGENAAHYNYESEKRKFFPEKEEPNYFSNPNIDLLKYKEQLQEYHNKETEFLLNYSNKYVVSEDFISYASAKIDNFYAFKLYQAAYFNKCGIPKDYLNDADIIQNPLSPFLFDALQFKYIYCSPDSNIERVYNRILNEVNSEFHSTLLTGLVKWFAQRGDRAYKESFLQVMEQIELTPIDSTLLATVQEYKPYYLLSGEMLPDSILDKTYLLSLLGNRKMSLRQFFDNYKDIPIFLDFWASWCAPCRENNRVSADNKSYFVEKQIAVVYISIDEDENAWLQATHEDHITDNQYLLLNFNKSSIYDYLKIEKGGIPRFVLFNKKHEIEILSAPRPVGCLFKELKEIIERYP